MSAPTPAERVAQAWLAARAGAAAVPGINAVAVAIGWATVELDRAVLELAESLGLTGIDAFRIAPRSAALGSAVRVAAGILPEGGSLAVLEPDTEGRLAGSLARLGEGPVAAWLAIEGGGTAFRAPGLAGLDLAPARDGPFGPERLILGPTGGTAGSWGRYGLLIVHTPGTIRP